jgi:hypothetical protein
MRSTLVFIIMWLDYTTDSIMSVKFKDDLFMGHGYYAPYDFSVFSKAK